MPPRLPFLPPPLRYRLTVCLRLVTVTRFTRTATTPGCARVLATALRLRILRSGSTVDLPRALPYHTRCLRSPYIAVPLHLLPADSQRLLHDVVCSSTVLTPFCLLYCRALLDCGTGGSAVPCHALCDCALLPLPFPFTRSPSTLIVPRWRSRYAVLVPFTYLCRILGLRLPLPTTLFVRFVTLTL